MHISQAHRHAHDALVNAKRVLIVSHPKPDGDTLGAACAMLEFCRARGIAADAWCKDAVPEQYAYMPRTDEFTSDPAVFDVAHDVLAVFDAGDLRFAGVAEHLGRKPVKPRILNFDHHATNERFGDVNVLDTAASSTAEVVYDFLRENGAEVNRAASASLLTGILTDTGNFSNPATTASSLEAASDLLRRGAKLQEVSRNLTRNKPISALRLWGEVLSRLRYDPVEGIASTAVFLSDLAAEGVHEEHVEGLSNFMNTFLDAKILLVLRELPEGKVKGSYRTASDVDVSQLAMRYGGGGHKKAAGFTATGTIVDSESGWTVAQK